jgi:hypothetical protein
VTGTPGPFKPIGPGIPPEHAGFHAALERLTRREEEEILSCAAALVRIALTPFRAETITGPEPIAAVPTPSIEGSPVETVDRQAQRVSDDPGPPRPVTRFILNFP